MFTLEKSLRRFNELYFVSEIDEVEEYEKFISRFNIYSEKLKIADMKNESEEHYKSLLQDLLKLSIYSESLGYDVEKCNDGSNADLTIKEHKNIVCIIENKTKKNTTEMPTPSKMSKKGLFEIIYYYQKLTRNEAIYGKIPKGRRNTTIRKLLITNGHAFISFIPNDLERLIKKCKLDEVYESFISKGLLRVTTNELYNTYESLISENDINNSFEYTYFNIDDSDFDVKNFYKFFNQPYFLNRKYVLLDKPKELNKKFYDELLYILGLKEVKTNQKILINANEVKFTLLNQLIDLLQEKKELPYDKSFDIAFDLIVTWLNRLLFIKLFESQLILFNGNKNDYIIFSKDKLTTFRDLESLFFDVFGTKNNERKISVDKYREIPYLNSSLFERSKNEIDYFSIDCIENEEISVYKSTNLKTIKSIKILDYIIDFLNSYIFTETYVIDKKDKEKREITQIVDASVLGLIFEKLNGYKDGSYYTGSDVTQYITEHCANQYIIDNFNNNYKKDFTNIEDVIEFSLDNNCKQFAINLLNSIKICDPACGSGHFLVSILNRIIYLKYRFKCLYIFNTTENLSSCTIDIQNDELVVLNGQNQQFIYEKNNAESQKIQKALFYNKQLIIENNLFGTDINPKAVSICRLRLWIELLKNAYYENNIMQTLPNIDLNIKNGNALISAIDFSVNKETNIKLVNESKASRNLVQDYKNLVLKYKNSNDKGIKKELAKNIQSIKLGLFNNFQQQRLDILGLKPDENMNNVYSSGFEWAIEFPELLNDEGRFIGFDIIVQNPPYIGQQGNKDIFRDVEYTKFGKQYYLGKMDYFYFFIHLSLKLLKQNGILGIITTNYFITADGAKKLREELKEKTTIINILNFNKLKLFKEAPGQHNMITILKNSSTNHLCKTCIAIESTSIQDMIDDDCNNKEINIINQKDLYDGVDNFIRITGSSVINNDKGINLLNNQKIILKDIANTYQGILSGADKLTEKIKNKYSLPQEINSGIFVISSEEVNKLNLNEYEKNMLKPIYKNSSIEKYKVNYPLNKKYVIYITKETDVEKCPNIINHLLPFKPILENNREVKKGSIPWYSLHWPRKESVFISQFKIVNSRRAKENIFGMETKKYFEQSDIMIITIKDEYLEQFDPFYILGLLNSTIYCNWYEKKGKLKGALLELYGTPLNNTPILDLSLKQKKEISNLAKSAYKGILPAKEAHKLIDDILNQFIVD